MYCLWLLSWYNSFSQEVTTETICPANPETVIIWSFIGHPWWLRRWIICRQCGRSGFHPWVGKIPCRSQRLPIPVFLPGKFHGQRNLVSYSPWGRKESDMTEWLSMHTCSPSEFSQLLKYAEWRWTVLSFWSFTYVCCLLKTISLK